jgi:hypothetical protein
MVQMAMAKRHLADLHRDLASASTKDVTFDRVCAPRQLRISCTVHRDVTVDIRSKRPNQAVSRRSHNSQAA